MFRVLRLIVAIFYLFQNLGSGPKATTSSPEKSSVDSSLKAAKLFNEIKEKLAGNIDAVNSIKGSFLFKITRAQKLAGMYISYHGSQRYADVLGSVWRRVFYVLSVTI